MGLKKVIITHMFPLNLASYAWGFAFPIPHTSAPYSFEIIHQNKTVTLNVTLNHGEHDMPIEDSDGYIRGIVPFGWEPIFLYQPTMSLNIVEPGQYEVYCVGDGCRNKIGEFVFHYVPAPPLTEERIAAIKTNPAATKYVRVELGCPRCSSKRMAYAALERDGKNEKLGYMWYKNLPDRFICECQETNLDLQYIRENLHFLIGGKFAGSSGATQERMYESGVLRAIQTSFAQLISAVPREESLHKFIVDNPILLHQFSSLRLLNKPPILNKHVVDIVLLTAQKELILIELERSNISLMKKNGGTAAEFSHACDQVTDWLHEIETHRLAILHDLSIEPKDVNVIRGVVIAGRDVGYDAYKLRKFKGVDRGKVKFLTYDDLLFSLDALIHAMGNLDLNPIK